MWSHLNDKCCLNIKAFLTFEKVLLFVTFLTSDLLQNALQALQKNHISSKVKKDLYQIKMREYIKKFFKWQKSLFFAEVITLIEVNLKSIASLFWTKTLDFFNDLIFCYLFEKKSHKNEWNLFWNWCDILTALMSWSYGINCNSTSSLKWKIISSLS